MTDEQRTIKAPLGEPHVRAKTADAPGELRDRPAEERAEHEPTELRTQLQRAQRLGAVDECAPARSEERVHVELRV